jgi:hypothetical protein
MLARIVTVSRMHVFDHMHVASSQGKEHSAELLGSRKEGHFYVEARSERTVQVRMVLTL